MIKFYTLINLAAPSLLTVGPNLIRYIMHGASTPLTHTLTHFPPSPAPTPPLHTSSTDEDSVHEPGSDSDDESDSSDDGETLQTLLSAMANLVDERERKSKKVSLYIFF